MAPPSADTLPPETAVVPLIEEAAVVVTVETTGPLEAVTEAQLLPTLTPSITTDGAALAVPWRKPNLSIVVASEFAVVKGPIVGVGSEAPKTGLMKKLSASSCALGL